MYIEPIGLFFLLLGSAATGALVWDVASKLGEKYNKKEIRKNTLDKEHSDWDIGAYSDAWWHRNDE